MQIVRALTNTSIEQKKENIYRSTLSFYFTNYAFTESEVIASDAEITLSHAFVQSTWRMSKRLNRYYKLGQNMSH